MVAEALKPKPDEAEVSNQILRLLDALPRRISDNIEVKLRKEFRGKWFQTWRNPEYDPARIKAVDMPKIKLILGVPDEFFIGTKEQIDDCIRRLVIKYQPTGVAA